MSEELKPCPFCGCDDIRTHLEWSMICANCGAEGSLTDSRADAIAAWNRRAALASTRTASDTRTAAGEAECDSALRAAPAGQQDAGTAAQDAAALAWQTALDSAAFYVAGHCSNGDHHAEIIIEMPMPPIKTNAELATRSRAEGGNTCATCNGHGSVGYPPDDYFDCPECLAARTQADAGKDKTIERAAEYLEHYANYLQEVKLEDIERHPYIPSIKEAAEELRAMLSASAAHSAEGE